MIKISVIGTTDLFYRDKEFATEEKHLEKQLKKLIVDSIEDGELELINVSYSDSPAMEKRDIFRADFEIQFIDKKPGGAKHKSDG
jgi:hypothetical protein